MKTAYRRFLCLDPRAIRLDPGRQAIDLDWSHIAEEIEDMGKSEKRAMESRLEVLLTHLLKWQIQQDRRSKSRQLTIKDQRRRLDKLLQENHSLKSVLSESIEEVYPSALIAAANEAGLEEERFPISCPIAIIRSFYDCCDMRYFLLTSYYNAN